MKRYFYLDESPMYKEKTLLKMDHSLFPTFPNGTTGSYNLLPSRILGISYPEYLRFARDVLKGEIIGKNQKYPSVFFDETPELKAFTKMLNRQTELIFNYYENPYEYIKKEDGTIDRIPLKEEEEDKEEK